MKILIIDDEEVFKAPIVAALEYADYKEISTAADGEEGIRKFEAENPDVVISDYNMPKLNGVDVLRHIRSKSQSTVVAIMSGVDDENGRVERNLRAQGANCYVSKGELDLKARILKILSEAQSKLTLTA